MWTSPSDKDKIELVLSPFFFRCSSYAPSVWHVHYVHVVNGVLWIIDISTRIIKVTLHFNTSPQHRDCRSYAPSKEHINWILGPLRDFVWMFANCSLELKNSIIRSLDNSFSITKWICICFVFSKNDGLETIWIVALLSQYNFISSFS